MVCRRMVCRLTGLGGGQPVSAIEAETHMVWVVAPTAVALHGSKGNLAGVTESSPQCVRIVYGITSGGGGPEAR